MLFGVANRASSTGSSGQGPPQSSTCCQGLGKPAYNTPLSWVAPATRPSKLALAAALKNSRLNNPWFQSLSKVGVDPFVNTEADATPPSLPMNRVAGSTGSNDPELATGEIEVAAAEIEVLAECDPLPFPIEGSAELNEEVRLRYRYLDIRRADMTTALRARSTAAYLVSDVMRDHGFVKVETPFLTRSTPEGARDFLVPVRLQPGSWYALPQSPQLFKQLLMISGLERYYQLVRCFRDEDFRADRQPEFTQIDIEMSFITRADVVEVAEDLFQRLWREIAGQEIARPIPQMPYADAMDRFGSDKPDLRFGKELIDLTQYFAGSGFRGFQAQHVGAVVMPGGAAQSRKI